MREKKAMILHNFCNLIRQAIYRPREEMDCRRLLPQRGIIGAEFISRGLIFRVGIKKAFFLY
jgi:hypothetical protein